MTALGHFLLSRLTEETQRLTRLMDMMYMSKDKERAGGEEDVTREENQRDHEKG